jgi:hypothetical protein
MFVESMRCEPYRVQISDSMGWLKMRNPLTGGLVALPSAFYPRMWRHLRFVSGSRGQTQVFPKFCRSRPTPARWESLISIRVTSVNRPNEQPVDVPPSSGFSAGLRANGILDPIDISAGTSTDITIVSRWCEVIHSHFGVTQFGISCTSSNAMVSWYLIHGC